MATYGYTRVSTAHQANDGLSLDQQRQRLAGWAQMADSPLDTIFEERGVSGSKPLEERPTGARLLAQLKPGDTLVACKLDRLFRSASDAAARLDWFMKQGVALVVLDLGTDPVTSNGTSALVFRILSAVAHWERERIAERVKDAKAEQHRQGKFRGGSRPFGYQLADDGSLVPDQREQRAIRRAVKLRSEGKSLRAIAETISKSGHQLSHAAVQRILRDAEPSIAATTASKPSARAR